MHPAPLYASPMSPGRRARPRSRLVTHASLLLLFVFSSTAARLEAQTPRAEEPLLLDFSKPAGRRPAFRKEGFAFEIPLTIGLVGRSKTEIIARASEPGRFEVAAERQGNFTEIKMLREGPGEWRGEVLAKVAPMSRQELERRADTQIQQALEPATQRAQADAQAKARTDWERYLRGLKARPADDDETLKRQYVRAKAKELGAPQTLDLLKQLATRRSRWLTPDQIAAWDALDGHRLYDEALRWLQLDIAEDYLVTCGFELDSHRQNVDTLIPSRFDGLYNLLNAGQAPADPSRPTHTKALSLQEIQRVRNALAAVINVRFYPLTDPQDANSQWFHGQRVSAPATGVSSVRVQGKLDVAANDRFDWWLLQGYDPNSMTLQFDDESQLSFEIIPQGQLAFLRISAKGEQPVSYAFEWSRMESKTGLPVVVNEGPSQLSTRFPF